MYGKQNKVCNPVVQAITRFECYLQKKARENFSEMNKIAGASRTSAICEIIYKCTFIPACNKHFFILIDQKKLFGNDPYCFALLSVILFLGKRGFLEPLSPTRGS